MEKEVLFVEHTMLLKNKNVCENPKCSRKSEMFAKIGNVCEEDAFGQFSSVWSNV